MLIPVQGIIEYSEDNKNWNQLTQRVILRSGKVYIYTHRDSCLQLIFSDMSEVKISSLTKLKLDGSNIFIYQGNTWFKVEKQKR